jgi:hypothetical protein
MSSLLHIASRIQAAAEAYASVMEHTDVQKWRVQFQNEKVCALVSRFIDLISIFNKAKSVQKFSDLRMNNPNMPAPDLHPILVALALVLNEDPENQDFSLITDNFPEEELRRSKYYNPLAEFPADLSAYLPPREDWWWEDLGA